MKYIKVIVFVGYCFLFPFLGFGQAASIPKADEYQALENDFKAEDVSEEQLELFQLGSIQKLKEFLNTTELLLNEKIDSTFISKIREQNLKNFHSSSDSLFYYQKNKLKSIPIKDLMEDKKLVKEIFPSFEFTQYQIAEPILTNKTYTWNVYFEPPLDNEFYTKYIAVCILEKREKSFGEEKKEVWQVFIKEIRKQKTHGN